MACEIAALQRDPVAGTDFGKCTTCSGASRAGIVFRCALVDMRGQSDSEVKAELCPEVDDPISVQEALNRPQAKKWHAVLEKENNNLQKHGIYEWAQALAREALMGTKTVLRVKHSAQGEVTASKHAVAHSASLRSWESILIRHRHELHFKTLHVLLAIAAVNGSAMRQFDVTSAYLHRPLREVVYIAVPPGLEHPSNPELVWRLLKPLYSTIRGGDYWAEEWAEFMVNQLGWLKHDSDTSTYHKTWPNGDSAAITFWADDAMAVGSKNQLLELENQFAVKYGISGQGELTWTLGIGLTFNLKARTITLSQEQ